MGTEGKPPDSSASQTAIVGNKPIPAEVEKMHLRALMAIAPGRCRRNAKSLR